MGTVPQIDPNCKANDAEVAMRELERAIERAVEINVADDALFEERESTALDLVNEGTRRYLEQELQEIADEYDDEILVDGVIYRRFHEPAPGKYHSLCGTLAPVRAVYREVGVRNGPTVVPMELTAGIVERATPALAYSIALNLGMQHSREYVKGMDGAYRRVPSRSTVDRIGKAIGTRAMESAPQIERYLRQSEGAPEGAIAVSVGLDRTTLPFEEERLEGAPPKTRRKKRTKPYERSVPAPIDVNYHMAYVGTVSFIDQYGDSVATRKYVATHHQGPDDIVGRMIADIRAAKRHMPSMVVGLMQDGGPEMWNVMRGALDAEPSVADYLEGIDRYHLDERLAEVLRITEPDPETRKKMLSDWNAEFDVDDKTIDHIELYIIDKVFEFLDSALGLDARDDETLNQHLVFIDNNRDRLKYVSLREAGLPVGSGATEGACKSAVNMRAKRSGQRWHDQGVSAILTLRAIEQSERLPRFWGHLRKRYCATVQDLAKAA